MLTHNEADRISSETMEGYASFIDPSTAKIARVMPEEFIEWSAEGAYITDVRGIRYLDAGTAGGVFGLGHRHPRVIAAVKAQLDLMPQPSRMGFNPLQAQLAHRLADITPGDLRYSFIASSGTEAVEASLKLARLTTGRAQIISTLGSFHGMSIACSSVGGLQWFREGFNPLLGECVQVPYGDAEAIAKVIGSQTAAVLMEPVQSGSGCTLPQPGYLKAVRELCNKTGALMVLDEIQTALGRTGELFGMDHEGVVPDILCLGKILGGGVMPIGSATYVQRVQDAASTHPNFNNSTFGGNQMACAAALATLDVIQEEGLVERAKTLAVRLDTALKQLASKYPGVIAGLKGRGLMRAIQLADARQCLVITPRLLNPHRIIIITPANQPHLIRINPPLIVTDDQLEEIIGAFDDCCAEAARHTPADLQALLDDLRRKIA